MKISDFLTEARVKIDVAASDKRRLLLELARDAGSALAMPSDRIFASLIKREELGSTGMGGGVAIPHARYMEITRPFGMFVRLRKAIPFDAVDGKPVDIVFLLLVPADSAGGQLDALASIARKLRNPLIVAALRQAHDPAQISSALERYEFSVNRFGIPKSVGF
jgi:nitrogen PTS system EIIA component